MTILRRAPRWLAVLVVALCTFGLGRGVRRARAPAAASAGGRVSAPAAATAPPGYSGGGYSRPYSGGYGYGGGSHFFFLPGWASADTATAAGSVSSARWRPSWWSGWWWPPSPAPCAPAGRQRRLSAYGGYDDGRGRRRCPAGPTSTAAAGARAVGARDPGSAGRFRRARRHRDGGRAGGAAAADRRRAAAREGRHPLRRRPRRAGR